MSRLLLLWCRGAIDRPRLALVVVALLTLAAAPGLALLELRTDGHALVPAEDPAVLFDAKVRQDFHLRDPIIVLLETSHPDGIYNPTTLGRLRDLTAALARLDGIGRENVVSLATERRDRLYPNTLVFRPFLDPFPDNPRLLAVLRSDVDALPILTGTLVSADRRALALLVGAPSSRDPGFLDYDRTLLYRRVLAAAAPFQGGGDRIRVVGAPVAESLLGTHIQEDLRLLLPISVLLICGVIWLGCRRPWGILLGLTEVGGCFVWTFGLMGWMGEPVYLTTSLLPVILTTVGVADDIHLLWRYQRVLAEDRTLGPHPDAVRRTMRQMVRPVALTSLTTLVGFLSFNSSSIEPVRAFGQYAGLGMLYCILYSVTALPAALTLLSPERLRHPHLTAESGGEVVRLFRPLVLHGRTTLAVLALATVVLGVGATRLVIQDGWIDGFSPRSRFHRDTDAVNQRMNGTHILLAHLAFDWPEARMPRVRDRQGPLLAKEAVDAVGGFEAFTRAQRGVGGVLGAASQLSDVSFLWHGRRAGSRGIPDRPEVIDRLLLFYDRVRGPARRRELVDDGLRRTVVTIFLKSANYRDTATLIRELRDYERRRLAPSGIHLAFAGDVAVSQAMIPAIVRTQIISLLLALAGSLISICVLYRSLRVGLLTILPSAVAGLWMFGLMGWAGIPLGVATSMFCAIALGVGVDYAIHFMERYDLQEKGDAGQRVLAALREAGPAITSDTVAIALGFGLLGLSQVPANSRLGLLVATALLASWLLTLAGLGALLALRRDAPSLSPAGALDPAPP